MSKNKFLDLLGRAIKPSKSVGGVPKCKTDLPLT